MNTGDQISTAQVNTSDQANTAQVIQGEKISPTFPAKKKRFPHTAIDFLLNKCYLNSRWRTSLHRKPFEGGLM